jgi:hypothetical protein
MQDSRSLINLEKHVKASSTQKMAAVALGISAQYLCDLLKSKRDIPDWLADKLAADNGYTRTIVYRKDSR